MKWSGKATFEQRLKEETEQDVQLCGSVESRGNHQNKSLSKRGLRAQGSQETREAARKGVSVERRCGL